MYHLCIKKGGYKQFKCFILQKIKIYVTLINKCLLSRIKLKSQKKKFEAFNIAIQRRTSQEECESNILVRIRKF